MDKANGLFDDIFGGLFLHCLDKGYAIYQFFQSPASPAYLFCILGVLLLQYKHNGKLSRSPIVLISSSEKSMVFRTSTDNISSHNKLGASISLLSILFYFVHLKHPFEKRLIIRVLNNTSCISYHFHKGKAHFYQPFYDIDVENFLSCFLSFECSVL